MLATADILVKKLDERRRENALRRLPPESDLIDFCSNDYLGLARISFEEKVESQGDLINGATGSRLISGNSAFAEKLEADLAHFHGAEAGLIFNSGYNANIGLLSSVPQRGDTIIYDQLVHASIRDGIRLSHAKAFSFRHNNLEHLEQKIAHATGNIFIVVESIYSMDGDEAPLEPLSALAKRQGASLIVDEAHATGVIGPKGKGGVIEAGLEKEIFARVHTFGKAVGCHGAMVVGSQMLRDYLINFSRPFIYTTALPVHMLKSIQSAYRYMMAGRELDILNQNIALFKELLSPAVQKVFLAGKSPIQSMIIPGNEAAKDLSNAIQEGGYNILPILHPTVPKGRERLRICIHAFNTKEEITGLTEMLNKLIR